MALGRPRWVSIVSALDAIAAGALFVVGVYLLNPSAFSADVYVEAGRYALIGGFLIYAAAALLVAAVTGYAPPRPGIANFLGSVLFGNIALLGTGALELALGVQGLLAEPMRPFVGALIVPGLLAFISSAFDTAARAQATVAAAAVSPESGKVTTGRAAVHLRAGVLAALGNMLVVAYLGFGYLLYFLLRAVVIEDVDIDLGRLLIILPAFFQRLLPLALALGAVMFVAVVSIGIVGDRARRRPELQRDLTGDEVGYISACVAQFRSYVDGRGYHALATRIRRFALLALFAGVGAGLWLMFEVEDLVAAHYAPDAAEAWSLYVVNRTWVVLVALVFALSWAFAPGAIAALVSQRLREAGGLTLLGEIETQLVGQVRAGKMKVGTAFDPAALLRATNTTMTTATLVWIGLLTAGLFVWWPHDRATDTLYTDAGVETGEFWLGARTLYPYASVKSVSLQCSINDRGDTRVSYRLALPTGARDLPIDSVLGRRLGDYTRVDQNLRAAGAAFEFALPEEVETSTAAVVDRMCVLKLGEGMDDAGRTQLEQLFHLDEWFERRWRLRTGAKSKIVTY